MTILSYLETKGKHSFDLIKIIDMIDCMIITNEFLQQIFDDISAVRGFL